jgi:coproporphyrinogen III oxidase
MVSPGDPKAFQERAADVMYGLQRTICAGLEQLERDAGGEGVFGRDAWTRTGGGGGLSRVMLDGTLFEKGGVGVSVVHGALSDAFAAQLPGGGQDFFATGVSLVLHPRNPFVPTVHANFRHIAKGDKRWFGGGADLTPYYYFAEDKTHFHAVWERYCSDHPEIADYPKFRDWCDRYFYLKHREERRGIGGIFFDYLHVDDERPGHAETLLGFVEDGGRRFLEAYTPIVKRHMNDPYDDAQRQWQELRRGRYVEYNLLFDRGTVFGLKTGGRTESILMSLPPRVRWGYCHEPEPGSPEAELLAVLREPPPAGPLASDA